MSDASHLAPVYAQWSLDVVDAEGVHLRTRSGRRVLDLYGGHAVAALGYSHPRLLEALDRQARALIFQSNAIPLDVRERAALRLTRFAGLGLNTAFFVNSGAEANENALKLALRISGRRKVVAIEGSFHGRTAAAGAVTWGAAQKWYGFPQAPFDVEFVPRGDIEAVARIVGTDTAAVIVEPIQGVAGAVDLGAEFLGALRERCSETCAQLVFDEVQCGMGRTGFPFAANLYGVAPDMLTTAKALGAGFPCSALLVADHVAAHLKTDDLGTTFGGGPMACAMIETVVDIIESEGLLGNVRRLSQEIRETCVTGPVTATQGAGFLLGLRTSRPAKDVQRELLEKHDILAGTSGDPNVVRILAPYVLESQRTAVTRSLTQARPITQSQAPAASPPMRSFLDLADLSREEVIDLLALAQRLQVRPEPSALTGKILGLLFFNPSLRTLASFQAGMMRLGGTSFVVTPGQGTWQVETRDGAVMNAGAAEHVREAIPVLASYCDALGIRSFAEGRNLADDIAETQFGLMARLCPKPLVNLESAMNHPCQALADWKTLDDCAVPRRAKFVLSWVNHPRALPLAVPAATVHMAAQRGMEVVVLRPEGYALPDAIMQKARAAAANSGGSVTETDDRAAALGGAHVLYAKEWGSPLHYGNAEAETRARLPLADWCVGESWFAAARPDCHLMHCLPVRRNVAVADEVLDGPRSRVVAEAANRMVVQMAVLYRLLKGTQE